MYLPALLMLSLVTATATPCAEAPSPEDQSARADALKRCWKGQVIALERSGETPGDIATAVILKCNSQIASAVASHAACKGPSFEGQLRTRLETRIREAVVAEVVTARSQKR